MKTKTYIENLRHSYLYMNLVDAYLSVCFPKFLIE